jgi:hypothetical protein
VLAGCANPQFTTLTIYETPQAFVRLEVDRTLVQSTKHSHPADISPERMAAVLRGIIVEESATRLPLYDDNFGQQRRHPAFTEKEVSFFAPLLAHALSTATPDEIVTFYETLTLSGAFSGGGREVTSGGLFVRGDELHLTLANYRSSTHYRADIGVADTEDDRLVPLRAIAPQLGRLDFEPRSAKRDERRSALDTFLSQDKRELIVLYQSLQVAPGASPVNP